MTKSDQTYKAPRQKKNRLSKAEYKKYRIWLAIEYPTCQICDINRSDDTHHLIHGTYGADKDDRTLLCVCRECHKWCHDNKHESIERFSELAERNWNEYNFGA